ncbi:serine/threonine-protein kinase [Deinococcus sp. 12RED42]|uniref:serine/threonine-protein kinase n=1 Tax=Deinococcus sp. 12RED42 TaxID=2745872 RepID=UPI001E331FF3|nr:serine/threonine-protein kinase [Deinococcus sp. 12RED42]MCD0166224.1 serine/threonine protein kinase [Deinococcus sp. 12RED42]
MSHSIRQSSLVGSLLNSRYLIDTQLGRGGFGVTYLATDQVLQRKVAIKEFFLHGSYRSGDSLYLPTAVDIDTYRHLLQRFTDEARALARFRHRNIVQVLDTFEGNGTAYIVMEYVVGETLESLLEREGPLTPERTVQLAEKLCSALELVHSQGLLHRDIKPANILVDGSAEPILIDFGAARTYSTGTAVNMTVILTPAYAPPEQHDGNGEFGPELDLYALAATLHNAVTGQMVPSARLLNRHTALEAILKDLPFGLRTTLFAALHVDPGQRPRDVQTFRLMLSASGMASTTRPADQVGRPARQMSPVLATAELEDAITWPFAKQTFSGKRQFTLDAFAQFGAVYDYSDRPGLWNDKRAEAKRQHSFTLEKGVRSRFPDWPQEVRVFLFQQSAVYNRLEFVYPAEVFSPDPHAVLDPAALQVAAGVFRRCLQDADQHWRLPDSLNVEVVGETLTFQLWYFQRLPLTKMTDAQGVAAHIALLMQRLDFGSRVRDLVPRIQTPQVPSLADLQEAVEETSFQLYSAQEDSLWVQSPNGSIYVLELIAPGETNALSTLKVSRFDLYNLTDDFFRSYLMTQVVDEAKLPTTLKAQASTGWMIGTAHPPGVAVHLEDDEPPAVESFCTYPLAGSVSGPALDWILHHVENRLSYAEAQFKNRPIASLHDSPLVKQPDRSWLQSYVLLELTQPGTRWEAIDEETILMLSVPSDAERAALNLPKRLLLKIAFTFDDAGPEHLSMVSIHAHTANHSFSNHARLLDPLLVKQALQGQGLPVVLGKTGNLVIRQFLPAVERPHPAVIESLIDMARLSLVTAAAVLLTQ